MVKAGRVARVLQATHAMLATVPARFPGRFRRALFAFHRGYALAPAISVLTGTDEGDPYTRGNRTKDRNRAVRANGHGRNGRDNWSSACR